MIDHEYMCKINIYEFRDTGWRKPNKYEISPNITKAVEWFNTTSNWVESEVVITSNLKDRAKKIKHFIDIADYALKLMNYSLVAAIYFGLEGNRRRLKETWDSAGERIQQKMEYFKIILSAENNYKNYRELIKTDETPVIPLYGVVFQDIIYLEDGSKEKKNYYNFKKLRRVSEQLMFFKKLSKGIYSYNENIELIEWLAKDRIIIDGAKTRYDYSQRCEKKTL